MDETNKIRSYKYSRVSDFVIQKYRMSVVHTRINCKTETLGASTDVVISFHGILFYVMLNAAGMHNFIHKAAHNIHSELS